jgi:hypothetical protein
MRRPEPSMLSVDLDTLSDVIDDARHQVTHNSWHKEPDIKPIIFPAILNDYRV